MLDPRGRGNKTCKRTFSRNATLFKRRVIVSSCKYLSHPGNLQDGEILIHVTGVPEMAPISAGINKTQTHQKSPCDVWHECSKYLTYY